MARPGDGAHVDDARDAVRFQQTDKFLNGSRGVTDRENERFVIFGAECGSRLSSRLPLAHLWRPFPDCAVPARSRHGYFSSSNVVGDAAPTAIIVFATDRPTFSSERVRKTADSS